MGGPQAQVNSLTVRSEGLAKVLIPLMETEKAKKRTLRNSKAGDGSAGDLGLVPGEGHLLVATEAEQAAEAVVSFLDGLAS
jgi:hypothetical protein